MYGVDWNDCRVSQLAGNPRFLKKTVMQRRHVYKILSNTLKRDAPPATRIVSEENLAHSAFTYAAQNLIGTNGKFHLLLGRRVAANQGYCPIVSKRG